MTNRLHRITIHTHTPLILRISLCSNLMIDQLFVAEHLQHFHRQFVREFSAWITVIESTVLYRKRSICLVANVKVILNACLMFSEEYLARLLNVVKYEECELTFVSIMFSIAPSGVSKNLLIWWTVSISTVSFFFWTLRSRSTVKPRLFWRPERW